MKKDVLWAGALAALLCLSACSDDDNDNGSGEEPPVAKLARCANMSAEPFVTRNDLAPGVLKTEEATLLLRFIQFSDDHIIDDEAQAINGAGPTDPLHPLFESAMRLQEEYSDETLNNMIAGVNACNKEFPSDFMMVTGDSADLTTVAEARRFIDNLDGTYDQMSAFETQCNAGIEPAAQALMCKRFTGRGVPDSQAVDPDPEDPSFQVLLTRTVRQILNTTQAALTGRQADGSSNPALQTATQAPGLPEVLRCHEGETGCVNESLHMPWVMAFGNHDGYVRGTVALGAGINEVSLLTGRKYMLDQHDFIEEFFFSKAMPGPIGHGFGFVEGARLSDDNTRNDGYYAFDAGQGKLRMIVLNTIMDGVDPRIPTDLLRNPFALSDGGLDQVQFDWLKAELEKSWEREQLVLVFSHHPDLTFAEYGMFAPLLPIEVTAVQLDGTLASYPNVIAWVAGHTHLHRVRPFKVTATEDGDEGSNGEITAPVECKEAGACRGFWQIETASLIDYPQEQRMIEILDNGDGSGVIRAPVLTHTYGHSRTLAEADDRCALYLSDPAAVAALLTDGGLDAVCRQGRTRQGAPEDRNVQLLFRMPFYEPPAS